MATNVDERDALQAELKAKLICRFCLTQLPGKLSNIYAKDNRIKSLVPLPVQVMAIASMEVFSNDGMPTSVCFECRLLFDYSYRFKQMCKKAENLLRQVPLTGQWPDPLPKPSLPAQLLPKPALLKQQQQQQQSQPLQQDLPQQQSTAPEKQQQAATQPITTKKLPTLPTTDLYMNAAPPDTHGRKRILNSNPATSPEPPVPVRLKKEKSDETSNFLHKVENNEEISLDDVQRLIAAEEIEFTEPEPVEKVPPPKKPKLLNKSSIRILNKEAEVVLEPRLSHPQVTQDEDGNMSIVTEILDPNEPFEAEPDPIKNAVPVKTNVFPCPHCERTFPLLQLRDIHLVNHTRERLFPCSECDRSFFSKYDLQKHTVIHTGEKKYKCTVCKRGFTRPTLLYRHEKVHTDIPKFLCIYCEKPFLSKDAMEKHAERHRKNRPFKCKVCSKSFAFKQGVERHEVVHLRDQPYPCQYCDLSFCTASKLARHLTAHAGKRPYPCKFCHKSYLLSHHLTRHLRSHKDSVVLYSCNECDKVYKTCDELIYHSAVHATVTLTCPLCQTSFENVETVTAHIKQHLHNEAFACEFCDLMFLTWVDQQEHVQRAHADEMIAYQENDRDAAKAIKAVKEDAQKEATADNNADLEQTLEEFLIDELPVEDGDAQLASNQAINVKQNVKIEQSNEPCEDEEFLTIEEDLNETEQQNKEEVVVPIMKNKTDADADTISNKTGVQRREVRRKVATARGEPTAASSNATAKKQSPTSINKLLNSLPKGVSLQRTTPKAESAQAAQTTPVAGKTRAASKRLSDGTTTAKTPLKTSPQAQGRQTRQILNKTAAAAVSSTSPTADRIITAASQNSSGDNVVKMKLGERHVKVQKIVITKAEAAAMAKEGRIRVKDGNLILTQGPTSVTK